MAGQPKPLFYVAVFLVVAGLIGFAAYRMDILAPQGEDGRGAQEGRRSDDQADRRSARDSRSPNLPRIAI